jgi:hypothetical protein
MGREECGESHMGKEGSIMKSDVSDLTRSVFFHRDKTWDSRPTNI